MADSDLLENNAELTTIKKVLEKEFNVKQEDLLRLVEEYEAKAADMGSVSLNIPNVDLQNLTKILEADGCDVSTVETLAKSQSEWVADRIDICYEEYLADGRFEDEEESEAET